MGRGPRDEQGTVGRMVCGEQKRRQTARAKGLQEAGGLEPKIQESWRETMVRGGCAARTLTQLCSHLST